jgi:hypothetical protein
MTSIIPANRLAPHELAQLGNNLAAAVRSDRDRCRPAKIATHSSCDDDDINDQIETAIQSEPVAS